MVRKMKSALFRNTPEQRIRRALFTLRALRDAEYMVTPGHPKEWEAILKKVDELLATEWAQHYLKSGDTENQS